MRHTAHVHQHGPDERYKYGASQQKSQDGQKGGEVEPKGGAPIKEKRVGKWPVDWTSRAPVGGAAAAASERGALAGPSAPTSTSTRWALVTL
jgi:hypothetical protein